MNEPLNLHMLRGDCEEAELTAARVSRGSAPRIERGMPDQDGNPGFFLTVPVVLMHPFRDELLDAVPGGDLGFSVNPPAWWIAARHLEKVRLLTAGFFGYVQEVDERGQIEHYVWRSEGGEPA